MDGNWQACGPDHHTYLSNTYPRLRILSHLIPGLCALVKSNVGTVWARHLWAQMLLMVTSVSLYTHFKVLQRIVEAGVEEGR